MLLSAKAGGVGLNLVGVYSMPFFFSKKIKLIKVIYAHVQI